MTACYRFFTYYYGLFPESEEVSSVYPYEEPARHDHSLGALQSVGITYTAPPSPPSGSHQEAFGKNRDSHVHMVGIWFSFSLCRRSQRNVV